MAVLKRHFFAVIYFSEDATAGEINSERTTAVNRIKSLGFTDAQVIRRGPFLGELASGIFATPPAPMRDSDAEGITYVPAKIVTIEVRP